MCPAFAAGPAQEPIGLRVVLNASLFRFPVSPTETPREVRENAVGCRDAALSDVRRRSGPVRGIPPVDCPPEIELLADNLFPEEVPQRAGRDLGEIPGNRDRVGRLAQLVLDLIDVLPRPPLTSGPVVPIRSFPKIEAGPPLMSLSTNRASKDPRGEWEAARILTGRCPDRPWP